MQALRTHRSTAALVVALIALFVALGGPAEAQRLLTGRDVANRSLQSKDLSRKAVKQLRRTPNGSVRTRKLANGAVTAVKLADGSVGPSKLAPGAVGSPQLSPGAVGPTELRAAAVGPVQLADGAVNGAKVADGALDARDVARFSGRFRVTVPQVKERECWSGEPVGLAPEQADADISTDLVIVTPDAAWPEATLAFTVRNSANRRRFVLAGCNMTNTATSEVEVGFRYMVVDVP